MNNGRRSSTTLDIESQGVAFEKSTDSAFGFHIPIVQETSFLVKEPN